MENFNFQNIPRATLIRAFLISLGCKKTVMDYMNTPVEGELLESSHGPYSFMYGNGELFINHEDSDETRSFETSRIGFEWTYTEI